MARKTKKQQEAQAAVEARLTSDTPVRLDATAVVKGGRHKDKRVHEIHPSLESLTQSLSEADIQSGTVTTASGMQVQISRPKAAGAAPYKPQAPEFGQERATTPVQEGISQRFEQRIGHEHGEEKAAELTAEADALAAAPNPLRSDGHVDMLVNLHVPSIGGNNLGHGGEMSRLARVGDLPPQPGSNVPDAPTTGRDLALGALGYSDEVQNQILATARDRISRRQGRGQYVALTSTEIESRAQGQVQEHLDEALHGTRSVSQNRNEQNIVDLADAQAAGSRGFDVQTLGERGSPAPGGPAQRGGGLGMTPKRTPRQRAQRKAVASLVRQKGGWAALQDADAHTLAAANDLKVLDLRQKARRAASVAPEERNTMAPGADPERRARRLAQPVFTTGPQPMQGPLREGEAPPPAARPLVGRPSEPKATLLPPTARPGAISPVPSNLPTAPARLGRTRTERGVRGSTAPWATPDSGVTVSYSDAIADYEASRPQVVPKSQQRAVATKAVPASESNVDVAQTEPPKKR